MIELTARTERGTGKSRIQDWAIAIYFSLSMNSELHIGTTVHAWYGNLMIVH